MRKFAEGLAEVIEKRMADRGISNGVSILVQDVNKNNVVLTGLVFKGEGDIAPVMYIDDYYDKFFHNDLSINDVADEMIDRYCEALIHKFEMESEKDKFMDWEYVKDKLVVCTYNMDKNPSIEEDHPFMCLVGDIGLYCRFEVSHDDDNICSAKVTNAMMDHYGISNDELFKQAFKSMNELHPCKIEDIVDVLTKNMPDGIKQEFNDHKGEMYVVHNDVKLFGSVYGFDKTILEFFCNDKHEEKVYIIPSSVNECIFIPGSRIDNDGTHLSDMVRSVNAESVEEQDFLSDDAFVFNRADGSITVVD